MYTSSQTKPETFFYYFRNISKRKLETEPNNFNNYNPNRGQTDWKHWWRCIHMYFTWRLVWNQSSKSNARLVKNCLYIIRFKNLLHLKLGNLSYKQFSRYYSFSRNLLTTIFAAHTANPNVYKPVLKEFLQH